jgi:hypothetical protein
MTADIRDYVLVVECGQWTYGEVTTQLWRVRAYTAADAVLQFHSHSSVVGANGKLVPNERLKTVVPYEPAVHGENLPVMRHGARKQET